MLGCLDVRSSEVWMFGCLEFESRKFGCLEKFGCLDVGMLGCLDVWMFGCLDVCQGLFLHARPRWVGG